MGNSQTYSLVTAPVSEPLTLTEAKAHIKQENTTADDTLITSLITAVRTYAESVFGCYFMTQTWRLELEAFPEWEIPIRKRPLQSIDHIKYYDSNGTQQTLATSLYSVDANAYVGMVTPSYGNVWPYARDQRKAIEIQFKCGWGFIQGVLPDSADYVVGNTPNWNTTVSVSGKTATQFTLNFGTAAPAGAIVDWTAQIGAVPVKLYTGSKTVTADALTVDVALGVAVLLSYVVGGIPEHLRRALLLMLDEMYEHRESNIGSLGSNQIDLAAKRVFASDRIWPV